MKNRRRYPRYETEFEARIFAKDLSFFATVTDISEKGIGILSETHVEPGTRLFITLYLISDDPIIGIPAWSRYIEREQKYYYRIGIETEHLELERLKAVGFPKRSKLLTEILSQTKKTDSDVEEADNIEKKGRA